MADSSGIRAGLAYYELSLKDGALTKGLRAWRGKIAAFGASVKAAGLKIMGLGSAMAAPLIAAEGVFSSAGTEMARMSERTGVSVEALSQLAFAAKENGVEMEGLGTSLKKMQQKLGEAEQGNSAAIDSFLKLGVSINDLKGLTPDRQFELLAQGIANIDDPARRTAAAMEIFGKTGTQLMPLFAGGAAGIEKLRAEADRLGLTMSGADATGAVELSKSLSTLWDVVKMGAFNIGAALAPSIKDLTGRVTEWLATAAKWISAHRETIVMVAKVTAGIFAAGAAVYAIGTAISLVAGVIGGMATALSWLGALAGVAASAIGVVGSVIAAIASPIGLVVAAVVGLGAAIAVQTGAASAALKWLGGAFGVLKNDAVTAFGGIKDALSAGDFKLAAQILWATLKLEWTRGIDWLETQWIEFTGMFSDVWTKAVYFTASVFTEASAALQSVWQETIGVLCDAWSMFTGFVQSAWNTAIGFVAKGWARIESLFDGSDYDKVAKSIDNDTNKKLAAIEDKKNQEIADREKKRKSNLSQIEQERIGTLAALEDAKKAELAAKQKSRLEKEKALQQEITDLIVKRDGLVQQASNETHPGDKGYLGGGIDAHRKAQQAQDGLIDTAKSAQSGTFNSMIAGRALAGNQHGVEQRLNLANRHLQNISRLMAKLHPNHFVFDG